MKLGLRMKTKNRKAHCDVKVEMHRTVGGYLEGVAFTPNQTYIGIFHCRRSELGDEVQKLIDQV